MQSIGSEGEVDEEKAIDFLTELTALTKKYGIGISGCGCCGSPYLTGKNIAEGARYSVDNGFDFLMLTEHHEEAIEDRRIKANA